MIRWLICLWVASSVTAAASDWSYGAFDNGAWFEAHVIHETNEVALNCGGASPAGNPLPQTDEPMMTVAYALDLTLGQRALGGGDFAAIVPPRTDVMVVSGSTGYQLPSSYFDALNMRGWITPLGFGDPLVRALLSGQPIGVDAAGQRLAVYDTTGLPAVLGRMIAFCDARWNATRQSLPPVAEPLVNEIRRQGLDIAPTVGAGHAQVQGAGQAQNQPQTQRVDQGLWASVQAHIARGCQGGVASYGDGYARAANIDGDGVADYVLLWDSIECGGSIPRPFCGASQCAVDVFASSIHAPRDYPKTVYAAALVDIVPGPAELDVLRIVGRMATCQDADIPSECIFIWGWVNGDLDRVN